MKNAKGFTVIELMFVLGIISILAVVAIPVYMDYTTRAKVSEGFNLLDRAKTGVTETYVLKGDWQDDNEAYGLPPAEEMSGSHVKSITAVDNVITVTYDAIGRNVLDGSTVTMVGVSMGGSVRWTCSSTILSKYLPASCR